MPSPEVHVQVGWRDGFDKEEMEAVNEMVDIFHNKDVRYAEDRELEMMTNWIEWASKKDPIAIKEVCHHYVLDFLQMSGYEDLLQLAKDSGLSEVLDFFENESEIQDSVEACIRKREEEKGPFPSFGLYEYSIKKEMERKARGAWRVLNKWNEVYESEGDAKEVKELAMELSHSVVGFKKR